MRVATSPAPGAGVATAEHRAAQPDHRPPRRSRRREAAGVLLLLILATLVRLPTLGQPLIEHHAFRQTQTAYTALLFHERGVDLLHPKLPVFGEPFEAPFEFPLFQALAAAPMSWGLSPDVAMRSTALACFLLSALLLWGLVRYVGGRVAAMAALALFLFSPFSLLWSRASLIEYLAVAGALGWLWAGLLWRDRRRAVFAGAALLAGVTVMLVKPTTGALWILPLLAYPAAHEGRGWRSWIRARMDPVLACIVVIPFLAAVAWTGHADAIKAASPATQWLTSDRLTQWNHGSIHQRSILFYWELIAHRITTQLTGYPAWLLPLAALVGLRTRTARFWAALAAVPLLTILAFWNLYVVHDYYLVAVSAVPAAAAGYGFSRIWRTLVATRGPRFLVVALATWMAFGLLLAPHIWTRPYRGIHVSERFPEALEARTLTRPGDLVAFDGYGWDPAVPYYARSGGRMMNTEPREQLTAAEMAQAGYRILVTARLESELAADTVRTGRWTGVLGKYVYITGEGPDELRGAPLLATDDEVPLGAGLLAAPMTLPCDTREVVLPRGEGWTILHLAPDTPRTAKLSFTDGYGDVPTREYVALGPDIGGATITLACRDATSITVLGVHAGPTEGGLKG